MKTAFIVFAAIISFSHFALAEEGKDLSGYQTLDMQQFNKIQNSVGQKKSLNFAMTCKTEDGREIKSSDPEFDSCLLKNQRALQKQVK